MKDINLLVCEDDEDICRTFSQYLESEGYAVESAFNGKEALEKAKEKKFSIALVDIMMPEMDGIEVIRRLKEITPDIDAVIITAHSSLNTAISALKLGAYDYLRKPVKLDEIGKVINNIVHQQKMIEAEKASVACIKDKLKKVAEENARLVEEIESLCECKENLLIDISHNLRTSVTIIQGYTEILLEKAGDAETRKGLRAIIEQCQSLTVLAEKAIGE